MKPSNLTDRRSVLKGTAALTGAALAGGAGFAALTGGAAAAAAMNIDINGTDYSGDQGDVDWLAVDLNKKITWDGFDVPLRYIRFKHEITIEDGGETDWYELYNKRSDRLTNWSSKGSGGDGWGGPGEFVASHGGDKEDYLKGDVRADVSWAIISDGSHPGDYDSVQDPVDWTSNLSVAEDGKTVDHVIKWKTTLTFYTENENGKAVEVKPDDGVPELTATERFGFTVTNEQSTSDGTSSGGATSG